MRSLLKKKRVAEPEIVIRTADGAPLARVPPEVRQEMQYLWTRLELHDGDLPRSIAVTSQLSGEGVSFVSRALAAVLARQARICLVEANLWGQGLDLPADGNEELAGLLQGSSGIDDVLVPTNHPGLWIVPSGDLNVSSSALVSSIEVMSSRLDELHTRFRHTIIDLPAISASSTALSFAAAAESSLLVVRQRVTRVDQVDSAANDLRQTRLLGVVINDNRISMPKFVQRRLLPQR